MRKMIALAAVGASALTFAACGNDASVSGRDTGPAAKINMPDHFGTIAHKCDGPNMVYESENGGSTGKGSISVVGGDPRCGSSRPKP